MKRNVLASPNPAQVLLEINVYIRLTNTLKFVRFSWLAMAKAVALRASEIY